MKILVTAGSTQMPIDKVRCITNIFKGKTGTLIAHESACRGHEVTLLANEHSKYILDSLPQNSWRGLITHSRYKTFDDLHSQMMDKIQNTKYDIIIHSAAVSDYKVNGVFSSLETMSLFMKQYKQDLPQHDGKIGSGQELFLRLTPTIKLVDQIRQPWGFDGILVKFKLQVNMSDDKLIEVATASMAHSKANIIVANSLEWFSEYESDNTKVFILKDVGKITSCSRTELASNLLDELEDAFYLTQPLS